MQTIANTFQVTPAPGKLGAEIRGVDISSGLDSKATECLIEALNAHGVVVFRNQHITPQQQVEFARGLGTLRVSFMSEFSVPGAPELTVVSNIRLDDRPIGLVDAGALWHTDGSYLARPDMYTVLHAIEIPRDGSGKALGDTLFLSAVAACAELPDDLRAAISGKIAVHSLAHHAEKKRKAQLNAPPVRADQKNVEHPVIRIHPLTGSPCLYVTEGHTAAITGMSADESDRLLNALWDHAKQDRFIYRHRWQEGDLLVWDNCATQHLAITDYGTQRRQLHRSGIQGPVPV